MPKLDLEPHEYKRWDDKKQKWVQDLSPAFCRNMMLIALGILAFIWWNRDAVTPGMLFGVTAMFAFFAGGFFANWLKDVY